MEIKVFEGDIERLRPLIESWKNESRADIFGMAIEPDTLLNHVRVMAESNQLLTMESRDGKVLGAMGTVVVPNVINRDSVLNEHIWYVMPEHRSRYSFEMVRCAEDIGRKAGCKHFLMTASRMISPLHDRLCRIYNRLGFSHFETTFIKEL